jgi:glutamyl/glutaminyl-tRNA synthetase
MGDLALTGRTVGPGFFEVIELLGKQTSIARLQKAAEIMPDGASDPQI